MYTYAIKWDEKILVTEINKDSLEWYSFIKQETLEENDYISSLIIERRDLNRYLGDMWINSIWLPQDTWITEMVNSQSENVKARIAAIDNELLSKEQSIVEDVFNSLFS